MHPEAPTKLASRLLPVLALLYTASMWGTIWYPLRLLEEAGIQGVWSTFLIFTVALGVGVLPAVGRYHQIRRAPWQVFMIAAASGWTNVAFILAVIDGTVMRVLLLFYLSPLWATVLGWWLLKETVSRESLAILALAMVGALTMLWDPALGYPWPQSENDWLAISAGFAFALSNVYVRKAQAVSIRVKTVAAWFGVSVLAMIWIVAYGAPVPEFGPRAVGGAVLLGTLGIFLMTWALHYGVTHMPVHRSAVILLFELVAGAISSLLLTDETVLLREWVGGALIVLAAYLSSRIHAGEEHVAH